ncbi:MAG: radical SAM protein [Methanolinea sp.]|jgi:7-carboxy-7-deazaguanine synthase|nr:radical SAM protein [Methanolinea sp.]
MKVSEIFRSIQGEGRNQGRPCTFIRLAGCNLRCSWCDTPHALTGGTEMGYNEVAAQVSALGGTYVCITGGEPLTQKKGLHVLVDFLAARGFQIDIETNGTIAFSEFQDHASICMDVKCPSSGEKSDLSLLPAITGRDSVKFVVRDLQDCEYAEGVMKAYPVDGEVFFSPVEGSDAAFVARYLVEHDIPARLQLQLHKILGMV